MRDPERIPLILAALEREWRKEPDVRLGQLLVNLVRSNHRDVTRERMSHFMFALEDREWLSMLGSLSEKEQAYVDDEPRARREGWSEWYASQRERRDD